MADFVPITGRCELIPHAPTAATDTTLEVSRSGLHGVHPTVPQFGMTTCRRWGFIVRLAGEIFNPARRVLIIGLVIAAGSACQTSAAPPHSWVTEEQIPILIRPQVDSVDVVENGADSLIWTVRFHQPMSAATLIPALSVRSLIGPVRAGHNQSTVLKAEHITIRGSGQEWQVLAHNIDLQNESWFLQIEATATNWVGTMLDGAAGAVTGNAGRSEQDYHNGAETFVSLTRPANDLRRCFSSRQNYDRPLLYDLTLFERRAVGESFNRHAWHPFATPPDHGSIIPARPNLEFAFRLQFTGPTVWDAMMDPTGMLEEIRFVDDSGAALTPTMAYNANPSLPFTVGLGHEVTGFVSAGSLTTAWLTHGLSKVAIGTGLNINPGDSLWLYAGTGEIGQVPLVRIADWDEPLRRLTLDRIVAASAWNSSATDTISVSTALFPAGWFVGFLEARFGDGSTAVVLGHDGRTFLLDRPVSASLVTQPVTFLYPRLEDFLTPPLAAHLVAPQIYLFAGESVQFEQRYRLTIGIYNIPGNLQGIALSDRSRDGDEQRNRGRNDQIEISFSILSAAPYPIPPVLSLNDGSLYPSVFTGQSLICDRAAPLCVTHNSDDSCQEDTLWFSFYTPDGGEAEPRGSQDLLRAASIREQPVILYRDVANKDGLFDTVVPVQWQMQTILAPSPGGPTSVFKIRSRTACDPFRRGDLLVIRHLLQALVVDKASFFDGNGDGVVQNGAEDDMLRWYAGAPTGFVTLEEFRQ